MTMPGSRISMRQSPARRHRPTKMGWLLRDPRAMTGILFILLLAVIGVGAGWFAPHDPNELDLGATLALPTPSGNSAWAQGRNSHDVKRIGSGLLMQTADNHELALSDLQVVTKIQPTQQQLQDLLFAWKVAKYVKSNAIVFCANGMTMGVGAGQMSRLDSARIASIKAGHAGLSLAGTAVASDAFFPFRDGLDVVVDAGATCVIQPGGSMRDPEVIEAANERGVAMVFSGVRHFRH